MPSNINTKAIIEEIHVRGMNAFFIVHGFGLTYKYSDVVKKKRTNPVKIFSSISSTVIGTFVHGHTYAVFDNRLK
ncbi:MAG TPA: hypothetical protein PK711_10655 [Bacteroidales bacterium]|nr:hypothetical protein [Bacteroidales bacterium]